MKCFEYNLWILKEDPNFSFIPDPTFALLGCHDTQHNDTQHDDTQHNDTQHNGTHQNNT